MSSGSKAQVVGYRYYLGVHMILCHGPVDQVSELIVGERSAWTGNVTGNATIDVNRPELFGGESREGGVVGKIDIAMGGPLQAVNAYLNSKINGAVPAYRGLVGAIFRGSGGLAFQWSAMNPYFKAPWWRVKRVLKGWNSDIPWYPEKAAIGAYDMNPAHIIYECLTNNQWGMGESPVNIDDANFRAVADRLHAEGFGLSCMWMDQTSIGDFIDEILRHVDGRRRYDVKTGKLQIHLMRDDYNIATLPELNESNIVSVESFQRSTWGEMTNEIIVKYTNRNQKTVSVSVQNLAGIEAQGGVVSVTRDYFAIRETALANRVAMRDLHSMSTPLAKITLSCNRVAWDWVDGDLFKLNWPSLGINGVPFRVSKIDKGTLLDGTIKIEAVEDIFQMPSGAYTGAGESGWEKPDLSPKPLLAQRTIEAPYWDVVQNLSAADIDYLPESWAFGEVLGAYDSVAYNFNLMHSTSSSGTYSQVGTGHFVPSGTLVASMGKTAGPVTFSITGSTHLYEAEVGNYAYIDNEIFAITAIDSDTETITADRGVLDSVPAEHAAGARIYFVDGTQGVDPTTRVSGETAYYKALPVSGAGALPIVSAVAMSLTLTGRAYKPYPPGNVKINGEYFPVNVSDAVTLTWAHRDRLQQTVSLTPFTAGNIGPEAGVTYSARLLAASNNAVLESVTGLTGTTHTFSYSSTTELVAELWSVRDGLASQQKQSHRFTLTVAPKDILILHFNGTDGSTTVTNSGEVAKTLTVAGNAKLTTTGPKFGTACLSLDGSGDWVQCAGDADFVLGAGNFTLECFINTTDTNFVLFDCYSGSSPGWQVYVTPAGKVSFYAFTSQVLVGTASCNTGTWKHIAITRQGATLRIFVDGALDATLTGFTTNMSHQAPYFAIGAQVSQRNSSYDMSGLIDEVRFRKGEAVYTAAFTPPTVEFE